MERRAYVGSRVRKLRGDRFLTGRGRYLDDIELAASTHLAILRSSHAHASIELDASVARAHPEALLVLTGDDVAALTEPIPPRLDPVAFGGAPIEVRPLAVGKVTHQGEPIAAVVAERRADAEALAALIETRYELLPVVLDADEALADDAPCLYPGRADNVIASLHYGQGDVDAALAQAPHRLADELRIQRYSTQPIETRGYLADWDARTEQLVLYSSSQNPHPQRFPLATTLRLRESQIRVIVPDLGGAFGIKMHTHREEPLICLASMLLGRPVRWIESRAEALLIAGREQTHRFEVGFDDDGRLLALRDHFVANVGAFSTTPGWGMARLTALTMPGGYKVAATDFQVRVVVTNKGPWNACRGYGKEATAIVLEHVVDRVARKLALDPAEVRRRNFVAADEFPYTTNTGLRLDSGNYASALDRALELVDYPALRAEQERAREAGRLLGIGIAFEMTPEAADFPGTMVGGFDTSTVRIDPSGDVTLLTGITSPGTGNDTAVAQIVADVLGIEPQQVAVVQGDTDVCPYGFGNGNGRSTIMGGGSAHLAALDVRAKLATVAGALLGVAPEGLEFAGGRVADTASGRSAQLSEVAYAVYSEAFARAAGIDPPLEATRVYRPGNIDHSPDDRGRIQPYTTFSNAVHVSVVEIDPETGRITLLRHGVVDDCGTMINPLAVAGQMHGAIGMGIGGALTEELRYDAVGQLLATGFKTYLTPRASDVPRIELAHQVTPSPFTLHGEKGAGEAGVGGSIAAILGAANDALAPLGVTLRSLPLSAARVHAAIIAAGAG